jgi:hypothetical protein
MERILAKAFAIKRVDIPNLDLAVFANLNHVFLQFGLISGSFTARRAVARFDLTP